METIKWWVGTIIKAYYYRDGVTVPQMLFLLH